MSKKANTKNFSNLEKKIIIGTAGIGMRYGILKKTNSIKETALYLKKAHNYGFRYIDTSPAYGKSYLILKKTKKKFFIITKIQKEIKKKKITFLKSILKNLINMINYLIDKYNSKTVCLKSVFILLKPDFFII